MEYSSVPVPPLAIAETSPSAAPKHEASVTVRLSITISGGPEITAGLVTIHPFESFT